LHSLSFWRARYPAGWVSEIFADPFVHTNIETVTETYLTLGSSSNGPGRRLDFSQEPRRLGYSKSHIFICELYIFYFLFIKAIKLALNL
jgi:hypothetical protein